MNLQEINQLLTKIATKHLDVKTLEAQASDELDFHEVAVWNIKIALIDAYFAGKKDGQNSQK